MKHDHEIAKDELQAAFAGICFRLNLKGVVSGGQIATDADGWKHHAYSVMFDGRQSFSWMQGTGIKTGPNPAEVLASCCRDFQYAKTTFDDFCADFGYDIDSRKAERVYFACQEMGPKLFKLGLTHAEIEILADLASRL